MWRHSEFCISDGVFSLWWMSCFLWRFWFMTVTIHFRAYRHCTVCCYVMDLLFYTELIYTPFCNGISAVFCFVLGLACFLLWPQVLMQNEMFAPQNNELPFTACQPLTRLCWLLLWVFPSGRESQCEERPTIKLRTNSHTAEISDVHVIFLLCVSLRTKPWLMTVWNFNNSFLFSCFLF